MYWGKIISFWINLLTHRLEKHIFFHHLLCIFVSIFFMVYVTLICILFKPNVVCTACNYSFDMCFFLLFLWKCKRDIMLMFVRPCACWMWSLKIFRLEWSIVLLYSQNVHCKLISVLLVYTVQSICAMFCCVIFCHYRLWNHS